MAAKQKHLGTSNLQFMNGVNSFFYEPGIGKKRVEILCRQLKKFGGSVSTEYNDKVSHIIMSKHSKVEKLLKYLKIDRIKDSIEVLDADWLSACFVACKQCDVSQYEVRKEATTDSSGTEVTKDAKVGTKNAVQTEKRSEVDMIALAMENRSSTLDQKTNVVHERKRKFVESGKDSDSGSSYVDSEDDTEKASASPGKKTVSPSKPQGTWVCTKPSMKAGENLNSHITEKLEVLAKAYTNTQDRWRALGYQKAISSIKNHPTRIDTAEEVRHLPFVGERLAKKIIEILETGNLRRLDHLDPNIKIINRFADVWGAGPKTAEAWVAQGFKTLDDLRQKADLTYQQKIGLKFYHEFLEKIDRKEVEEIEQHIRETACELISGMEVVTCGSYRRGRQKCGDVDILISHADGRSHKGFLKLIIDALQNKGLITDDLITVDNEEQRKYMGVFKLPYENTKHRRLDIIVAPYAEWSCALVHFTGSGRLNRSMRQLAKTKDMSLSEHALREGVIRKGQEKLNEGTVVPVFSEEDIFHHLGLNYLQPHERDW